jgi:hypothetical protein
VVDRNGSRATKVVESSDSPTERLMDCWRCQKAAQLGNVAQSERVNAAANALVSSE